MKVSIRYFAHMRELVGCGEEQISIPDGAYVQDLIAALQSRHAGIGALIDMSRIAINLDFTDAGAPLQDGDEIAFIPPVSGG